MALTTEQYKTAILRDTGQGADPTARAQVDFFWDLHAGRGSVYLQYLYSKLSMIEALLGGSWQDNVDTKEGDEEVKHSQKGGNLGKLQASVLAEIKRINGGMSVSVPTATAPVFIGPPSGEFG